MDKEEIRREFLTDWVKQATTEEIVEKLIQNDERAKKIAEYEKQLDLEYVNENFVPKALISKEIKELEEMKVTGSEFITARNFAVIILKKEILGDEIDEM